MHNYIKNPNFAIISCFTGEYCLANFNYCSEDGPNFSDNPAWANFSSDESWDNFQSLLDETGWDCIVAIPNNELQSYFDSIMNQVKKTFDFAFSHDGHLGDDTFYDYLPDAQFMLGQIAYHLHANGNKLDFNRLIKPFMLLIERYDANYSTNENDELLIDQLYTFDEILSSIKTLNNID